MSSILVSLEEVSEEVVAEMSGGREIFGEAGRTTSETSFEQGEEVGATAFGLAGMSRMTVSETSSELEEEVSAIAFGMSGTSSVSSLSCICSPTDMKWFDNDHAKGLPTSFIECPRYPNPVPLRSLGIPSASVIPCS